MAHKDESSRFYMSVRLYTVQKSILIMPRGLAESKLHNLHYPKLFSLINTTYLALLGGLSGKAGFESQIIYSEK